MDVSVYSPGADAAAAAAVGADLAASPAALFASCTHVALQCALTDETRGLVDLELIRSMPAPGPRVLVNVARGGVAVEADVAAAAHLSCVDYLGDVPWDRSAEAKDWYARVKSRPAFRELLADHVSGLKPVAHYTDLDF